MTAETQRDIDKFVEGIALATIKKPSARDKQKAPGPSDLADKCDRCVAQKIANYLHLGSYVDDGFSLKAWIGTAVHEKLERDLPMIYRHAEREIKVAIADIPGIGPVSGHIDVFLPRQRALTDWKTSDVKKIDGYKKEGGSGIYTRSMTIQERTQLEKYKALDKAGALSESDVGRMVVLMAISERHSGGVPESYLGQTMLYLYGLRASGREADHAVLGFIPRDSNNVSDIWVTSCQFRPDVAEGVLNRAAHMARIVRAGKIDTLSHHPQCFPYVIRPRLAS